MFTILPLNKQLKCNHCSIIPLESTSRNPLKSENTSNMYDVNGAIVIFNNYNPSARSSYNSLSAIVVSMALFLPECGDAVQTQWFQRKPARGNLIPFKSPFLWCTSRFINARRRSSSTVLLSSSLM